MSATEETEYGCAWGECDKPATFHDEQGGHYCEVHKVWAFDPSLDRGKEISTPGIECDVIGCHQAAMSENDRGNRLCDYHWSTYDDMSPEDEMEIFGTVSE